MNDNDKRTLYVQVPARTAALLKAKAALTDVPYSQLAKRYIEEGLARNRVLEELSLADSGEAPAVSGPGGPGGEDEKTTAR